MPIRMMGRYEEGSEKDLAHKLLEQHEVKVDHVFGVDLQPSGMQEITFTHDGRAQTAFAQHGRVEHVMEGWDVLPPKPADGTWRGGY